MHSHGLSSIKWRAYSTPTVCDIRTFAVFFSVSRPFFASNVFMRGTQEQFSRKVKQSWKWKFLTNLHFLCGGRLPGGMNKNSYISIGRCVVAMVTALDHVGLRSMFWPKKLLSGSKNKRVWFSGACEPIQMKFIEMVEPLSQFIKFPIKVFWVL